MVLNPYRNLYSKNRCNGNTQCPIVRICLNAYQMKANDEGSNLSYLGGKWNHGVRSYDVIKVKIDSKRVPDYIQKS